ncbi:nucleoside diphosphate-linked moiety X motif 17 isoform X2 [Rhinatrema bivittatum]|uniref:nucleoside diphosphate-linked moiety X motif 17 isoform X2 n=1 Tax=Rhinatrema bivittatum TaxID=194408 RepID=UPI00112DFB6F|nr:nucleoside diphosphate-linked moiety X motif 17 isoform X2 [Rhinatrema bivittatum]
MEKRMTNFVRSAFIVCSSWLRKSITGEFCAPQEDKVSVSCGLDRNKFIISNGEFCGSSRVLLKRPPFCPIKNFPEGQACSLPPDVLGRGVDVGVAVILQSVDTKVLLTRRAASLNTFPNVWVPPGGHIELHEQPLDAGLRELAEETGLRLEEGSYSWRLLGLWESVFPPMLTLGLPVRHHVVMYLLLLSLETHLQLQARLHPDEEEVSASIWLEPRTAEAIVEMVDGAPNSGNLPDDLLPTVRITELCNGAVKATMLPISTLLNTVPAAGVDLERVSTGTKYALQLWLDTFSQPDH